MAKTNGLRQSAGKAKKVKSKASVLSAERILNSDSETDAPMPSVRAPATNETPLKKQTKRSEPVATTKSSKIDAPNGKSTPAQTLPAKKALPTSKASIAPVQATTSSSEDSGSSSDSEEGSSEESARQVSGVKRKAHDLEKEKTQPQAKRAKLGATVNGKKQSSSSDDNSNSEESENETRSEDRNKSNGSDDDSSDGEDIGEDVDLDPTTAKAASAPNPLLPSQASITSIPAKPFKPPTGYTALKIPVSALDSFLSAESLQGKQIWHISAPANVPLTSLKTLTHDAIRNRTSVLVHERTEYSFHEDKSQGESSVSVMLPTTKGYETHSAKVHTNLRLQPNIVLPNLSQRQADPNTGSSAAADIAQPSVRMVRPQPRGLHMRYKPPGFGSGDPGKVGPDSDSDDNADVRAAQKSAGRTSLQFPKALGAHTVETLAAVGDMSKPAKNKKSKKSGKGGSHVPTNGTVHGDAAEPAAAKSPALKSSSTMTSRDTTANTEETTRSKEEKAKRKEMKKLKKEAKLKAVV